MENTINIFVEIFGLIVMGTCSILMLLLGLFVWEFYKDEFRRKK
jgi:hypothetical protein